MEEKQIKINIVCDKNFAADFLRDLANYIENSETEVKEFETYNGCAEITDED